jgi:hypothetical protein
MLFSCSLLIEKAVGDEILANMDRVVFDFCDPLEFKLAGIKPTP